MTPLQNLGQLVKQKRTELGLTQQMLAYASELSRTTINELEAGVLGDLSFNRISKLMSVLSLELGSVPLQAKPRKSAIAIVAFSASVSYKKIMSSHVLKKVMLSGKVPAGFAAHVSTALDEIPITLWVSAVLEAGSAAGASLQTVWSNLKLLAKEYKSPRVVWQ